MTEQATQNNMTLWDSVRTPDPSATKSFSRSGGFKGTAMLSFMACQHHQTSELGVP